MSTFPCVDAGMLMRRRVRRKRSCIVVWTARGRLSCGVCWAISNRRPHKHTIRRRGRCRVPPRPARLAVWEACISQGRTLPRRASGSERRSRSIPSSHDPGSSWDAATCGWRSGRRPHSASAAARRWTTRIWRAGTTSRAATCGWSKVPRPEQTLWDRANGCSGWVARHPGSRGGGGTRVGRRRVR